LILGDLSQLKFDQQGLIPAIVQDAQSGDVLTLAYMNQESLQKTIETGTTWFWSRSRGQLWPKGATSGHIQKVRRIHYDCDADALLVQVDQVGVACHEGYWSCFHHPLWTEARDGAAETGPGYRVPARSAGGTESPETARTGPTDLLREIASVVHSRRIEPREGSYTSGLFAAGLDRILKKVGEEAGEVIIAAKNGRREEITWELADLWFHTLVTMEYLGVTLEEVLAVLETRRRPR